MKDVFRIADEYQRRAWAVVQDTRVQEIWQALGAEINLVGSLRTGLLIRHRDIDFHIYTDPLLLSDSFRAVAMLAENRGIREITYRNLLDTPEMCLEWHASYDDPHGDTWQIDMIHISRASPYAGWFEDVAARIQAALNDELREAILTIKYAVPDDRKVPGVKIYMAVMRDDVRSYDEFVEWEKRHPEGGILLWAP